MTQEEFRNWYDTLSQDDQLKVMRLVVDENFDLGAPEEVNEKVRDTIRDKFYGKSEHRMSREDFKKWLSSITDPEAQQSVCICLAEALYEDHNEDDMPMAAIRQHVYDIFPEWH